jgi:hypothetical protein
MHIQIKQLASVKVEINQRKLLVEQKLILTMADRKFAV